MRFCWLSFLVGLLSLTVTRASGKWAWRCVSSSAGEPYCLKERRSLPINPEQITLNACKLTCGTSGTLVPRPKHVIIGKETVPFIPSNVDHNNERCEPHICPLLMQAVALMVDSIKKYHPDYTKNSDFIRSSGAGGSAVQHHILFIQLSVNGTEEYLSLDTDESYTLNISTNETITTVIITANTFFGARHALETLSQLIDYDEEHQSLQIVSSASIEDSPTFPYRGLIIDTSRNFMSVKQIKKVLDGMSYNKLNIFHWHITDSHSFPLQLNTLPQMAEFGAYSPRHVYKPEEIKELVKYARVRGIQIIPEIDAPAHVGHGWEWGEEEGLGKLVVCLNKQPFGQYCLEPPCGQLNLANDNIYNVLGKVYKEIIELFEPVKLFHYGGDEINFNCYNTTQEVVDWMTAKGFGLDKKAYYDQWGVFQEKARQQLTEANHNKEIKGILWTSELTKGDTATELIDNKKYIIQIWTNNSDSRITDMLTKGYDVIFSNFDALYFDCGSASWVGKGVNWCSPYKGWQDVYDNDIHKIALKLTGSNTYHQQILGAEAAAWSEQIDEKSLDGKLWPRGSALGERLWTNPSTDYSKAVTRIVQQRYRLMMRGLNPERLQPEWCRHNEGQCLGDVSTADHR